MSVSYPLAMSHQMPTRLAAGQRMDGLYAGDISNTTVNTEAPEQSSTPRAVTVDHHHPKKATDTASSEPEIVNSADVLLCDLGNKAMVMEDLENALRLWTKPTVLIAGRNSLDGLPSNVPETILCLDLSWNRITVLKGFAALPNLRELDLSHNGVQDMLGLVGNTDLRVLRISHNRVRRIEGLQQLKRLEEADLSHNLLKTTDDVRALSLNGSLCRLRVEGNPFCTTGVQYGSYEIAMQHLLPGMSLLDGKPQSLPRSVSLPPPHVPTSAAAAVNRGPRGCSPHVASARDGQGVNNVSGDLSVTRGWRDSPVTRARNTQSLVPAHEKQKGTETSAKGGRGDVARVKATTGGGGPALAPGSYVELFAMVQRKKGLGTAIVSAQGGIAAGTASMSYGTHRGVQNTHDRQPVRGKETAMKAGFHAPIPGDDRRRAANAAAGNHDDVDGRVGDRAAHTAGGGRESVAQPPAANFSLQSNRGLSRSERAAARRLAWSQARQDGAVRAGTSKCQRKETSPTGALASRVASRTALGNAPVGGDGGKRRALGSRSPDHSKTTARERSIARRSQGGAMAQEPQLSSSQALADRRSCQNSAIAAGNSTNLDRNGSGGGSSSGMACGSTSAPQNPHCYHRRQVGMRSRARDGNAKPGARRQINGGSRQTVGAALSESTRGSRGGRSGRGGAHSTVAGGGISRKQDNKSSTPSGGGSSGEDAYRYKTTLGQRSRRGSRPLAPHTSPWTPRQDAKPWREGESSDGRRERDGHGGAATDDLSGSRYFAPTEVTSTSTRREESLVKRGGGRVTTKRKGNVVHYQQHHLHHHHQGGEYRRFDQNDGGEDSSSELERFGGGGGESSSRAHPYVSPLSPAGILQRACSARSSVSRSATSTAERIRTTAALPRPRWMGTTSKDSQEEIHLEDKRSGRGRWSALDVEMADPWQARAAGVWKDSNNSDTAQALNGTEPYDEDHEEEHEEDEAGRRGTSWRDQPPPGQSYHAGPHVSPTFRKDPARDDNGSDGYQIAPIPLPSELHPSESISLGYSVGTGTHSSGGSSGGSGSSTRGDGDINGRRGVRDNRVGRVGQTSMRGGQQGQQRAQSWTDTSSDSVPRSRGADAKVGRWNPPTLESPPLADNVAERSMTDISSEPKRAWLAHHGIMDNSDQDEWKDDRESRVSHRDTRIADRLQLPSDTDPPVAFERSSVDQQDMTASNPETAKATRSSRVRHDDGCIGDRYDRYKYGTVDDAEETLSQKELLANAGIALEEVRGVTERDDGAGEARTTRKVVGGLGDGLGEDRGEGGNKGTSADARGAAEVVGYENEVVGMLTSMVGGVITAGTSTGTHKY